MYQELLRRESRVETVYYDLLSAGQMCCYHQRLLVNMNRANQRQQNSAATRISCNAWEGKQVSVQALEWCHPNTVVSYGEVGLSSLMKAMWFERAVLNKWGHVSRLALLSGLYRMLPKELYSYLTLNFLQHSLDIFKVETLYAGDELPDNRHSLAHTDRGILIRRSVVEENIADLWK